MMRTVHSRAHTTWRMVAEALTRPYPVRWPMVLLVALVPLYLFIPDFALDDTFHAPELALDRMIPVQPVWSLVYGALYMFLIVLPVLVVRHDEHIRRTVFAYLTVWLTSYVVFLVYPTVAPRPEVVTGDGFAAWGLRGLYGADPPYNCFPSIHVAHSFVSALTCLRVHRGLGIVSIFCATIVGISTLYTKQHYVVDVIAGALLAIVAYLIFLRRVPREENRIAPALAMLVAGICAVGVGCYWIVYAFS